MDSLTCALAVATAMMVVGLAVLEGARRLVLYRSAKHCLAVYEEHRAMADAAHVRGGELHMSGRQWPPGELATAKAEVAKAEARFATTAAAHVHLLVVLAPLFRRCRRG